MRYLSRQTGEQLRAPSSLDAAVSGAVVFARSDRTPLPTRLGFRAAGRGEDPEIPTGVGR
ncbi:MAG: hypothetical protein VYB51_10545 [Gemmatimonadota bacterium]|nr:hypothetical protein [Gemmatimonadota bacterium]